MSNILNRFKNNTVGSANKDVNYTDELLPSADLERKEGIYAIIESWRNILITPERSVDHDPEYGSKLPEYIFEQSDEVTQEEIIDEIKTKLMTYDNRATIGRINIHPHMNRKGYTIQMTVRYKGEEQQLKQSFDESLLR